MEPEDRAKIQEIVQANGGLFSADLIDGECTHLVAVEAKGDKYTAAKRWGNVHIVSTAWIEECVKKEKWVQELPYLVALSSSVGGPSRNQNQAFETLSKNEAKISAAETVTATATATATVPPEESHLAPPQIPPAINWGSLPSVDKIPDERRGILRRDTFFISGFDQVAADYLISLVLAGGGARHFVLTTSVTKILLGPEASERLISEAFKHPCGAACVKVEWLVETLVPGPTEATNEPGGEGRFDEDETLDPHRRDLQDSLDHFDEELNVRALHDRNRGGRWFIAALKEAITDLNEFYILKAQAQGHGQLERGGGHLSRTSKETQLPLLPSLADESQVIDWCEE